MRPTVQHRGAARPLRHLRPRPVGPAVRPGRQRGAQRLHCKGKRSSGAAPADCRLAKRQGCPAQERPALIRPDSIALLRTCVQTLCT